MSRPNMENQSKKLNYLLPVSFLISIILIVGALIYSVGLKSVNTGQNKTKDKQIAQVSDSIELPIKWGNLGKQLVETGVIDAQKFETLYAQRGGLTNEQKNLLYAEDNGNLIISPENAGFVLNLLWALGLGNENPVLENGPMADSKYGGAENFASTGGWTLTKDDVMNHYNQHRFINLTPEQQKLAEKVSKNIYRPCCGNSTYFPDCNHGMAMLGLLELMASQGINENVMYQVALIVNSYWFPDTYLTIARYFQNQGINWEQVSAKEVLGYNFSSLTGYQRVLSQITPSERQGGGSCGV